MQTLVPTALMDVEEISDSESLEEITAEDFSRGSCKSRASMPGLINSPSPRNSLPVSSDFAWEEEAVVIEDSSEEEAEEGEIEEGETYLVSIEDNSEEAASEMEMKDEEAAASEMEMKDAIIDLGSESQVAVEITTTANCESKLKESVPLGEFDKRVRLIREELESVNTDEAAASFESCCGRVRKSFDSLNQIYRESWVPIPNSLDQSIVIPGTKKEEAGDFLLRTLNSIKNRHSYLLTTEQLQELDAMVRSLVGLDNKGSNTISPVSTNGALLKLEEPCVTRAGESTPLPDHHMVYDIGSLNCENAKPLPTQKPNGPGATMEGAFDAFLRCVPDASQTVSNYQHKYRPPFFLASNQRPSPNPSMNDHGNPHMYGGASSSLVGNNARAVNYAHSSPLPGHSSSSSCITSSNGLRGGPVKTVGQFPVSTPAVITVGNRDPRFRISNPEIGCSYDHNRCQLPRDFSTHNGFSGGSVNLRRVDEPLMVANTLKRQRIQLTGSRMKPESNALTSQSSNMNVRKHKAVEPLLGVNALKRQRTSIADSRDVPMKPGWLEERSVTSQSSNMNVAVQPKRPKNGVVSNRMSNANSNTNVINDGTGQKPPVGAAPSVSLPPLLKDISVYPAILTQLLHNEQRRLGTKDQQKTEGVSCDSRIIHNANLILPGTNSEYGTSSKASTKEQNSAVNSQLPDQTVSMNTQTDVGGIHEKPFYPPQISYSEAKTNGNQNKESSETVRGQEGHTHKNGLSSHPAQQPDIAQLVTDKLKDIASTMSSLQSTITSLAATQNISQPIPNRMNEEAVMLVTDDSDGQTVSGEPSEQGTLGVPQKPNPWGDVNHLLDGYDDQQVVSIQRERARRIDEQNKMFAARKLSLVLDLDHTLLNSAKFTDIDPTFAEKLRKKEEIDRGKPKRHLFRFQHMGLWTKLRPGIWNFLERASKLFELHIYTMGNKMYATEIAKVLDPTGTLFAGRVISRGDDNPVDGFQMVPKSKDLDGVLGMESGVVIIDDSLKVWPYNKQSLIVVERYTYFPCSRRQFGLSGPSLLEIDHDERVKDGTLASSLSVIERVHEKFFSHCNLNDADVRNILSSEQRKILKGCRIVFSRIFPVEEANPHLHPLWQTAEQFGAVCTNQIDEQVTHVVANLRGTDKVTWALSTGRFVVQPGWVEASALLYRRAKEHEFVVKP